MRKSLKLLVNGFHSRLFIWSFTLNWHNLPSKATKSISNNRTWRYLSQQALIQFFNWTPYIYINIDVIRSAISRVYRTTPTAHHEYIVLVTRHLQLLQVQGECRAENTIHNTLHNRYSKPGNFPTLKPSLGIFVVMMSEVWTRQTASHMWYIWYSQLKCKFEIYQCFFNFLNTGNGNLIGVGVT